jgi:hypothetical protein
LWTFGQLSPLSLLFLSLSHPKKRKVGHTHNTKTYIYIQRRSDELHFGKNTQKNTINTNIQRRRRRRRRRSDELHFEKQKNTHKHKHTKKKKKKKK